MSDSYWSVRACIIIQSLSVAAAFLWLMSHWVRPTMSTNEFLASQLIGAVWMAVAGIWRRRDD